jgi:phage shock protein PspC (stress-responsive transcriptional regulator)
MDDFFDKIRSLGVTRPDEGRWGAGVAAGLARRWDIDVVLVRGIFVALTIVGGLGVAAYGLAWLFLPQDDGRIHLQQAIHGEFSAGFVGAVILSLAAIGGGGGPGPWHYGWGFPGGLLLTVAVIAGIWWLARGRGSTPYPPGAPGAAGAGPAGYSPPLPYGTPGGSSSAPAGSPESSRWSGAGAGPNPARLARDRARELSAPSKTIVRFTLGVALLAAAAILVIGHQTDWSAPVGVIAAATALGIVAGGVIASGLNGRRSAGLIGIGILLAIGTLSGAGAHNVGIRAGQNLAVVGSQDWRPSTADKAGTQYNLGVGEATLWLTDPAILADASGDHPLRVSARIGAGHLIVVVPDHTPARIEIQIGAGEVVNPDGSSTQVNGNRSSGNQVQNLTVGPAGRPLMIVQVQQGVGQLEIKTASQAASTATTSPTTSPSVSPSTKATTRPTATASAKK